MNYKLAFALGLIAPGTVGREQWETVFEGTTTVDSDGGSRTLVSAEKPIITIGANCKMRVTVDGVSTVLECEHYTTNSIYGTRDAYRAGNRYIRDSSYFDTGYDFYIECGGISAASERYLLWFFARNSGTYSVKIEVKE